MLLKDGRVIQGLFQRFCLDAKIFKRGMKITPITHPWKRNQILNINIMGSRND